MASVQRPMLRSIHSTDDLGPIAEAIYPAQPSPATGINNYGQVIGGSPAFVFGGGVMNVLDDLIPADSGWKLIMAYGINDTGQIVAHGRTRRRLRDTV